MDIIETTKDRILRTAKELFSRRGFDGVSVGRIADEVGINKATIYHHFTSKKEILDLIVARLVRETIDFRIEMLERMIENGGVADGNSDPWRERFFFIEKRREEFHIILLETMKKESEETYFFDYIDAVSNNDKFKERQNRLIEKMGISDEDREKIESREAHFNGVFLTVLPIMCFQLLKEKFGRHYNWAPGEMEEHFIRTIGRLQDPLQNGW